MNPQEFIASLYLGDRAIKSILFDGWDQSIRIQVDDISRIRDVTGNWNYYIDEDILNGYIVFDNVISYHLNPQGYLPNDFIEIVSANKKDDRYYEFILSFGHCDENAKGTLINLRITAEGIHLEDPQKPNFKIVD